MADWTTRTLMELVSLQRGFDITERALRPGPYPVFTSSGLQGFHDEFKVKGPGVIIGRKGSLGTVFFTEREYWPNSTTLWSKDFHGNWPRFVYYFLKTLELENYDCGTSNPTLNRNHIHTLPVRIPPVYEQREIANTLHSLDSKCELNLETNTTLESMTRAVFKSWFIDFDPVRAKAEGKKPFGMDDETAALFPDSFEDSELGKIPKGWGVKPFSSIVKIIGGGTPKTSVVEYWDGDIPWFSVKDVPPESEVFVLDTERHISLAALENSSTRMLDEGSTIVTARGTVGKLAMVATPMAMNQSCYALKGLNGYPDFFIYWTLKHRIQHLLQQSYGTVFDTITTRTFDEVMIPVPPVELAREFDLRISPLMMMVRNNLYQSRTLASMRDVLLPRLLSGEIRLSQVSTNECSEPEVNSE